MQTEQDLREIADLIRGKNIAVFSDEPYCHMVWKGQHHSLLAQPGMLEQCVAAYTFRKRFSFRDRRTNNLGRHFPRGSAFRF